MVRKIGQLLLNWGGGGWLPPHTPLSLILEPRRYVRSQKFFMDRCPKDEHTGKNLVCKKALPISEKNWKNLLGGGGVASTFLLAIGGLIKKITKISKRG